MPDCTQLKARLDQLTSARDKLLQGKQIVVVVDANRSRIEYKPADVNTLYAQIALAQAEYDACVNGTPKAITKPFQFFF